MNNVVHCPKCNAANRPNASYCMRCGKVLPPPDNAATRHALAFVESERGGPYFGAFPQALDFTPASLAVLDTLITEMWGVEGLAPGQPDWQPPASKMPVVINLGAYLGEVLVRHLPARWEMHPQHPDAVIAARVVDAQGRRINPFAQLGARFRDGTGAGLAGLYSAVSGRILQPWTLPRAPVPAPRTVATPAPPATPAPAIDPAAALQEAAQACARGHFGNAIVVLRQLLQTQPAHREARKRLAMALGQAGALDEALHVVEPLRRSEPANTEWIDLEATLLAFAGRLQESIGRLEMALTRHPDAHALRRRRGFVYLQAQQWARAQADLEKVLQLAGDDDGELRIGLAQAALQQGDAARARAHLQAALALPASRCPPPLAAAAHEKLATLT